jgi:predicted RNase H-like HicB family nuclease
MGNVKNKRIELGFNLPVKIVKKQKWYVASCPILDVFSQGPTEEQAKKNLGEALTAFLTSCLQRSTLDAVLKECGFKPQLKPAKKEEIISQEDYINIPIPFLVKSRNSENCHA